jgi:hypothetical protein
MDFQWTVLPPRKPLREESTRGHGVSVRPLPLINSNQVASEFLGAGEQLLRLGQRTGMSLERQANPSRARWRTRRQVCVLGLKTHAEPGGRFRQHRRKR